MKLNIKHIAFLILATFYACNGPNLTELTVEQNSSNSSAEVLELENVAPTADGGAFSANYDSTGQVNPSPQKYFNIISFSKIEIENANGQGASETIDYASAQFFDRTKPVKNNRGQVIGYKSVLLGDLYFNNFKARTAKSSMHYMMHGMGTKMGNGMRYMLVKTSKGSQGKSIAAYGGVLNVRLMKMRMRRLNVQISVPQKLKAQVFKEGNFKNENLRIALSWQNPTGKKLEVVLGGIKPGENSLVPLIRFKTPDDGKLVLPSKLVNSIPLQKFKYLILTMIRRIEKEASAEQLKSKFYISSQSIQNLRFEIK